MSREMRQWERGEDLEGGKAILGIGGGDGDGDSGRGQRREDEKLFRHGASPFRTASEPPPKFSWTHAWGMMTWGKKAGPWGKGPEGLKDREKDKKKSDDHDP